MPTSVTSSGITFPDSTTQTTAAAGGVTSLNGQTGAITDTNLGAIGSLVFAAANTASILLPGATIAGSNLWYHTSATVGFGDFVYSYGSNYNTIPSGYYRNDTSYWKWLRIDSGNTGYLAPNSARNMTSLSGTWRLMGGGLAVRSSSYDGCANTTGSTTPCGIFVRVS